MTPPAAKTAQAVRTPAGHARDKILSTAFRLFYAQGLRAAGIDTIIAESGVAKATFYKYFPAKDELILAYLEKVDGIWTGQLHAAADAAGPDPAARLVGLFDALESACRRDGYRGCAFINAAAESASGTRVHERTVAHKHHIQSWIHGMAEEAGARNPGQLARSLTLLLDGGLASGVLDADPAAAAAARASAAQLVAAGLNSSPETPDVDRPHSPN
ncbi:TetR/AcrR family transcriptional regulator [Arthrobacter sp. UYEF20]|uniref:TetR/AcrR family transcriptional regulator n=1 Tax=Arthrobacter sp. UYEF20 TaxID=1756363 RepID=UPI00339185AA